MNWPIGPYGTSMGLLLALTLPLHMIWTRKNPDYRVAPSELISEIRTRGYIWHISLYLAMFVFKAFTDYHNEPLKAMVGGFGEVDGKTYMFIGQQKGRNTKERKY
ncbi:MAG: hypothetical protein VXZ65_03090, partial [Candidatus Thermoplasmatota archaeon]|nr:hypothetical protein [Candidatus Thermoplasmatota archaeon]